MNKLLNYAYLSIDKEKRDFALADYARLKPNSEFYSHSQAIKRLYKIKYNLGALIKRLPNNLMIAGSTTLACVYKDKEIIPHDLDIYMSDNDHKTVTEIDSAIRATYHTEIIVMRTQYTINWFLKDPENKGYPIIQLVLPPVRHWSEVFSSSHSDLVCIGFLVGEKKFVYGKGRWDRFYNEGYSYGTVSFTDEEYQKRVYDAVKKYQDYGFKIKLVASNGVLVRNQIENSPRFHIDVVVFEDVEEFIMKHPQVTVGKYLHNVYSGEIFKDYIETMSIFNRCPICSDLIIERKVCEICKDRENNRLENIKKMIRKSDKDLRYLVTGGRCGLGNQISKILMSCGRDVTVTTRFPKLAEGKKTIQLDMKDPKSVEEFEKEVGNFDVLILSAAETLHYSDTNLPNNPDIKNELDWTNDFHREDTGIWHKCIDEHTDEEIEDPIHINITSIAKIIRAFVAHQVKNKPSNQKTIIYVTSAEGAFVNKSPFHPVTNMTKSAIEQLICTLKRQADILGMNIVMADPGWMYTKSTNGKNVGPIKLEWGAAQVLSPLADIFKGSEVENASLWKRKKGFNAENPDQLKELKFKGEGETCPATFDDTNVMIKFYPCEHKLGLPAWYHLKNNENTTRCPLCRAQIENTEIVSMIAGEEGRYEYNSESDNEAETGNSDEGKENSKSDSGYGTEKSDLREGKDWSNNDDGWIAVRK